MKFLAKILILAFAAKTFMATPNPVSHKREKPTSSSIGDMTLRELSNEAMGAFSVVEAQLSKFLS